MTDTDIKAHGVVKKLLDGTRSGEQVWMKIHPDKLPFKLFATEIDSSATCFSSEYGPFQILITKTSKDSRFYIEGIEIQCVRLFMISPRHENYSLVPHTLLTEDLFSTVLRRSSDVGDQLEAFLTTPNPHTR